MHKEKARERALGREIRLLGLHPVNITQKTPAMEQ